MRVVLGVAVATIIFGLDSAAAQPMLEPAASASDPRLDARSKSTTIPVAIPDGTEVMTAEGSATSAGAAPVALEHPIDPDAYVCGPGDSFELNFWGKQNFRLRMAADLEGRLFISKVGFVVVAGKTLTTVRGEVNKKVHANYPGLRFELTLVAPRTFQVHVVENVLRPGGYTAQPLERVSAVLARAGGVTETGSRRRIAIKRKGGSVTADLVMYELTGDTRYNPYVLDGDVLTVPSSGVVATITGAVRRPGTYELVASHDLTELLELAGGLASTAIRSLPVRITRRNAKQQETFIEIQYEGNRAPNGSIQDGDRVVVRGADELQRYVELIGATVRAGQHDPATTSKRLPFVEGDTVLSLIERAGGITANGDLSRSYVSRPRANQPPELIALDLDALLVRRDFRADMRIQMGDTIVIPPRQYGVRVEGAVARSGIYIYNPKFGIAEYIAHAGGRTRSARDLDEIRLIDEYGRSHPYSPGLKPAPGDAILVPERNFTRPEIVQIVLSAAGLVLSGVAITLAATR